MATTTGSGGKAKALAQGDNGGALVVAGLRNVTKLVLAPAWAIALPASVLSRRLPQPGPWLAPLALALSGLLWAWRHYGGT